MQPDSIQKLAGAAVDRLVAALDAGDSEQLRDYLAMLARFHHYSVGNMFLIVAQCPKASRVAGYRTWQRLGRQVKRGSKAIRILAPIRRRAAEEDDDTMIVGFRSASVFDISQTDGKDLPEFARAEGDPGSYTERLKGFVKARHIELDYAEHLGGADGLSRRDRIVLRRGLSAAEEFSVLVHETAHCMLHCGTNERREENRTVRETEAEAVAFVVCEAASLEARTAAADYIRLYQGDKKTLLERLERIQRTAGAIIRAVCPEQDTPAKTENDPKSRRKQSGSRGLESRFRRDAA